MKKVKVMDVQFDACTLDEALERMFDFLENRRDEPSKQIVTPNPEILLETQTNEHFRNVLNRAFLSIPDGIGVLWGAAFQNASRGSGRKMRWLKAFFIGLSLIFYPKYCRRIFPERVTGTDLMGSICSLSRKTQSRGPFKIFLLGGATGVAEKTREYLETKYSGAQIAGTFSGAATEFDFPAIQTAIAETQPEILFVAFGAPKQELWIAEHLHKLPSVRIAMGVGGAFDFLAGVRKRAPKWMQKTGLEWLYRLIQEPARAKRIWNAAVKFPLEMIKK